MKLQVKFIPALDVPLLMLTDAIVMCDSYSSNVTAQLETVC
jgi:hypothetical protein